VSTPDRDVRRRTRWAGALLAALTLALVVATVAAPDTVPGQTAYLAVSVGAAGASWYGRLRHRARRRMVPWVSLTLSLNALGDVLWQVRTWSTGVLPDVSLADAAYLASYATLAGALVGRRLGGRHRPGARFHATLDGCAALTVALFVVLTTSVARTLADSGVDLLARLVWIGYPVLDAVLIGLIAWRVVLDGRVRPSALLGLTGVTCWLVSDLGSLLLGPDVANTSLSVGWLLGIVLLAAVPWTRPTASGSSTARPPGHGPWRMVLNTLPFAAPAVVEVIDWHRGVVVNPVPGLVVWAVLLVLAAIRTRVLALESERAWEAARSQTRRYEALAVNSSDAVAVVDPTGRLTAESRSLAGFLGRPADAGRSLLHLLSPLGVEATDVLAVLDRAGTQPGTPVELELRGSRPAGGTVWLGGRAVDLRADPDVAGIVVSVYDITARKLAEEELSHQAFHDGLTGLANRSLFLEHTEQALRRAGRSGSPPIVLCLDLDGFKDVNDSLGHLAGDELLRAVAARLRNSVRVADTVARLGGDEFAVLVDDTSGGLPAPTPLADRLLAVIGQPNDHAGQRVTVAASIGIVAAEPLATPVSMFRDADIAMYRAKTAGRCRWVVFDPDMRAEELERIELERDLAEALPAGQLRLVYQPVVDLGSERVVGFEALLRWDHPRLGPVGPDRFVPVAEDSGLIVPIGRWALAEATRTAARWQRLRSTPLSMAVNVSARQLSGGALLGHVAEALAASGLAPSSLVLEVTETALVTDPDAAAERLSELRALGTRLALDDFGTGYSSLSYLRQFDVDVLKIDRSFVGLLDGSWNDAAIVHGLVQLGRRLRLEVVAEGVETTAQRDLLRAERCDLAQGYLFAAPLEADDAELLLREQSAKTV
jgi:diguanylate cyclase (GGDEF)-like protein/PAS domain S-box-containing protein